MRGRKDQRAALTKAPVSATDVTPDERVDACDEEGRELHQDDQGKLTDSAQQICLGNSEIETEEVGQPECGRQNGEIESELESAIEQTMPPARGPRPFGSLRSVHWLGHASGIPGKEIRYCSRWRVLGENCIRMLFSYFAILYRNLQ